MADEKEDNKPKTYQVFVSGRIGMKAGARAEFLGEGNTGKIFITNKASISKILFKRGPDGTLVPYEEPSRTIDDTKPGKLLSEPSFINRMLFILDLIGAATNKEPVTGDLVEWYKEDARQFGEKKARYLICVRIGRGITSFVWGWMKKLTVVALCLRALEWVRKIVD